MFQNILSILGWLLAGAAAAGLFDIHHLFAKSPYLLVVQVAEVLCSCGRGRPLAYAASARPPVRRTAPLSLLVRIATGDTHLRLDHLLPMGRSAPLT